MAQSGIIMLRDCADSNTWTWLALVTNLDGINTSRLKKVIIKNESTNSAYGGKTTRCMDKKSKDEIGIKMRACCSLAVIVPKHKV
jgi:hypothetical protein